MSPPASRRLLSLGVYLAFASSAFTLLLTLALTLALERSASQRVAVEIGAGLADLASQVASRLDRATFERHRELQLMASRLARLDDPGAVQAELDNARNSYRYYAWLGVTDAQGVVRAGSGGLLRGADVSSRPWFRGALEGRNLGDVHEALLLGQQLGRGANGDPLRLFDVAVPLQSGGRITGVLAAHISWDWAKDVQQAVFGSMRGAAAELLIVARDGRVLLGPDGVEGRQLQLPSVRRAQDGERGYLTERWAGGGNYLVGHATTQGYLGSPGLGWLVLVRKDLDAAHAPVRQLGATVAGAGGVLALVFVLIGWLGARAVTRPLLELARTARQIEQGKAVQVRPSQAFREVRDLGAALNSLLQKLQHKTAELHALNAQLEQRVAARTAELERAFERVRADEQRIQSIIEDAQDPFIGVDLEGRITDWNTQAEVVFGWRRQEVLGRVAADLLLPARYADASRAALKMYAESGQTPDTERPLERVMVDRQGREIPVEIKVRLVDTGGQRFFSAFVHDISRRKEIDRMKNEFVSTVSHELRTPLTAIYGSLSLLASGMAGELPPDARQLVKISHDSTERLVRLVNDMLDLEKIASGKMDYHMVPQALRPLLAQAVRDTAAYAQQLGVRLRLEEGADARVLADADRIVQVCVNLLSNAAKFSPADGEVQLRLELQGNGARVSVHDRGPGVPPAFRDRIFQRFSQADASDQRAKGGTGLGLAICRSIIEAHHGRIDFDSTPGAGSVFFFELPLAD